ncbi:hypothetical protein F2Q68_00009284 [Brassica cretica]|uniref:Uncharacterized protein n=1 Tax=Brassica cretica TaxID=69181 RepID=A0A8S9KUU9_BRACR|nr:hypothetical protein F2Q68_00009284 [Brassica cretica]
MHGFVSYRRFGRARSLRSDPTERMLGRYVATGLDSSSVATSVPSRPARSLVETERDGRSVATQRPSLARARSLHRDRTGRTLGHYVATKLGSGSVATCVVTEFGLSLFRSSHSNLSVAGLDTFPLPWDSLCLIQTEFEQDLNVNFVVTVFDPNNGLSDIDSVVTDFDPNS